MGTALFKIKLMPESPEVNFESLKEKTTQIISELQGDLTGFEEQPIAFGLKALIIGLRISEDIESSEIEEKLGKVEGVSSVQIIDYRRAIN